MKTTLLIIFAIGFSHFEAVASDEGYRRASKYMNMTPEGNLYSPPRQKRKLASAKSKKRKEKKKPVSPKN